MNEDDAKAALNRNFREKVRLVGENKAGKYSSVWTFRPGGDGFYLSSRSLINAFKVSLHANNHRGYLAYEKKYFGKLKEEGWLSAPNKIVCDWALPELGNDGAIIAASIKLPADFMTADTPPYVSQKKAAVFEIEPGCALEIGVFLSRERGESLEEKLSKIGLPLFEFHNENWLNVALVVRSVQFDPAVLPFEKLATARMQPLQEPKEGSNLNVLFWSEPKDGGAIEAVDVGGANLRRSEAG